MNAKRTLRELDAQLAEKVFSINTQVFGIFSIDGARLRERDFESREEAQCYIASTDEGLPEGHKSTGRVQVLPCVRNVPYYSTDPKASQQLREKLAEIYAVWELYQNRHSAQSQRYRFAVWNLNKDGYTVGTVIADGNTEELAVALCAAKAYGIEVGELEG